VRCAPRTWNSDSVSDTSGSLLPYTLRFVATWQRAHVEDDEKQNANLNESVHSNENVRARHVLLHMLFVRLRA
jgi:hypothetical protein